MTRPAAWTGAVLIALGMAIFLWKTVGYGLPLRPSNPKGLWQVEVEITARGYGERGSVRAALPVTREGQFVFDEHERSDRLAFRLREEPDVRLGVWSGRYDGVHRLAYAFRVQLSEVVSALPEAPSPDVPEPIRDRYLMPSVNYPSDAEEVRDVLLRLRLPGREDPVGRMRALYAFVTDEVTTLPEAGGDALLTLARREGSALGTERLLVTLLRAAELPARPVSGLRLRQERSPEDKVWTEVWIDENWVPVSPSEEFFAHLPVDYLVLQTGDGRAISASGVRAFTHSYQALREVLQPEEIATMMVPDSAFLGGLSLYRLPVGTQANLRLLLLLPLGALLTALFRNVVGIPTFGTFMPALIALALRAASLGWGLLLVGSVLTIGILGRLLLDRLRLLMVPRLSVLLCLVVLTVMGLALAGRAGNSSDLFGGILLPIVILTMLIERFSITSAEEGMREALIRSGGSMLIAVSVYPLFTSEVVEHVMFGFPELVVVGMGLLVLVGGYTGYRVADLLRFRSFLATPEAPR